MSDLILLDGDVVNFQSNFGVALVLVRPGTLKGSGPRSVRGKAMCVENDESRVSVPGCAYTTPQYSIPGVGTLKISRLAPDQKAVKTSSGGKKVLLKGATFIAKFEVTVPAQQQPPPPASPIPDAMKQYVGSGSFATTNIHVRGT